jgi:hypothetical protein
MYVIGGWGMVMFDDVWRSRDGKNWEKVSERLGTHAPQRRVMLCASRCIRSWRDRSATMGRGPSGCSTRPWCTRASSTYSAASTGKGRPNLMSSWGLDPPDDLSMPLRLQAVLPE